MFYIQPTGDLGTFYELNATTDISVTQESTLTNYPIETGLEVTDNVVLTPRTVSFKGILTDVKQAAEVPIRQSDGQFVSTSLKQFEEYIRELQSRIDNKELFNAIITDRVDTLKNVIITSFVISKDNSIGGNAWFVSLDMQRIRLANPAQVDVIVDADFTDLLTAKKKANDNSQDVDGKQRTKVNLGLFTSGDPDPETGDFL